MASKYAICTLLTNDAYLPGAIALVAALRDLHPRPAEPPEADFQAVCLVTPETVDVASIKLLRRTFDVVVGVEIIEQDDEKNLHLLGTCLSSTYLLHIPASLS
jgi:glycogenin